MKKSLYVLGAGLAVVVFSLVPSHARAEQGAVDTMGTNPERKAPPKDVAISGKRSDEMQGVVTRVGVGTVEIKPTNKEICSFQTNARTKVLIDKRIVGMDAVRVGTPVRILYKDKDNTRIAREILIPSAQSDTTGYLSPSRSDTTGYAHPDKSDRASIYNPGPTRPDSTGYHREPLKADKK